MKSSTGLSIRMFHAITAMAMVALFGLSVPSNANQTNSMILLETSLGDITLQLYPEKAPVTVKNFTDYVGAGFFDGLIFHRVIKGFMIQGGGLTPDMKPKPSGTPILNEADNGLSNEVGTIAMARTSDPHSATAQFFINLESNEFLNHTGKDPQRWGYAVFGQVIDGMDVVRAIGQVATQSVGAYADVPTDPVIIRRVRVLAE